MAGWSSRNKYSMLGAMRAIAQMISYEVPLILSSIAVVMTAGTLSLVSIVDRQAQYSGILPHWYVLTPWGFAGFILFMIAAAAEVNRSPFDLPEGESEIIGGYFTEYSGFKFALFFLAEYLEMFAVSGLGITLFLGGWSAPFSFLTWIPSWIWFFAKLVACICGFIWVRGTVPRLRMDQLMNLAWKLMLPMSLVVILAAGLWRFLPVGVVRWLVCAVVVAVPYVLLARMLAGGKGIARRIYVTRNRMVSRLWFLARCAELREGTILEREDAACSQALKSKIETARRNIRTNPMTSSVLILAAVTLAGAVAAMTLRKLVHCALALAIAFAGLATLYLGLDAQFAGLAQFLVYVGAIAILIVFAILLTPSSSEADIRVYVAHLIVRVGRRCSGAGSLRDFGMVGWP